jgi:hypothetical protein
LDLEPQDSGLDFDLRLSLHAARDSSHNLLGRVAKKKAYLRLANKKKRLRWAKEHRHWSDELCLEG